MGSRPQYGSGTHDPTSSSPSNLSNSTAYTLYNATGQLDDAWGNTEFEQGYDPFRYTGDYPNRIYSLWGSTWYVGVVPLTASNQKLSYRAKLDSNELEVLSNGTANAYINLWIFFPQNATYKFGEIEIYIHKADGSSPTTELEHRIRTDQTYGNWPFVGRHATNLSTSDFTDCTVDLTPIINKFHDEWNIDLSTGAIGGITFGVECERAKMKAIFDYVKYQY